MTRINLLPEHLRKAQRHRLNRRRVGWLLALCVLAGLVGVTLAQLRVQQLSRAIAQAEQELQPLLQHRTDIVALQQERDRLSAQAEAVDTLREPVSPAAVLALLSQLTPEDVTASRLVIEYPAGARSYDASAPPKVTITLDGVARLNTALPKLVRELMNSRVFDNVQIGDSRELNAGNTAAGQQFHLSTNIPLTFATDGPLAEGGRP